MLTVLSIARLSLAQPIDEGEIVQVRETIQNYLRVLGEDPENVDIEAMTEGYQQKRLDGVGQTEASFWVTEQLGNKLLSFAPIDASQKRKVQYLLPFDASIPRLLLQGSDGTSNHSGDSRHALHFIMPIGTEVLAARNGTVVSVRDGAKLRNAYENPKAGNGNWVTVLHGDGTFANYGHLEPGIAVEEGQQLKRGERIGLSGQTGFAMHPHLHFEVRKRINRGESRTLQLRMTGGSKRRGFAPQQGRWYTFRPESSVELRILAGRETLSVGHRIAAERGKRVELRVELVREGVAPLDVTLDPRTRYDVALPWNLTVPKPGQLVFGAESGWEEEVISDTAVVAISYRDDEAGEYGVVELVFSLGGKAQADARQKTHAARYPSRK
jgi:murein DD-endopeptidase MepM/ murein hydrolase activator NlpD